MVELPELQHPANEIRGAVEEVLSRPEFASSQASWWEQLLTYLGDVLNAFTASLSGGGIGQLFFSGLLIAVCVAIAVAAVRLARRVRRSGGGTPVFAKTDRTLSAAQWEALASAAQQSGDLREAVRCKYRALIVDFHSRGLLEELPGQTAGQYAAIVTRDVPRVGVAFQRATEQFERAWYGITPVTGEQLQAMTEAVHAAKQTVGATSNRLADAPDSPNMSAV